MQIHGYNIRQEVLIRECLIAYAPDARSLSVIAVMHARRNPRVMAAIPRGRE